jgi:predicted acylesterase/phospholipase RssA
MARANRRDFKSAILAGVLAVALAACSAIARNPVPDSRKLNDVLGVSGPVRFWGDEPPKNTLALVREAYRQRLAAGLDPNAPVNFLAVSGGGSDGAFGAGLLVGWSDCGTRPSFELVTGISTGALIAPFAFMGSAYDQQLKEVYTAYGTDDIAQQRNPLAIIAEASAADNAPLANLIAKYIDADFMAAVAREARKGRGLFIGTTFLDAQRPVIWDMGAIAVRGDEASLALFRKVLLASASIPGVFPPAMIPVEQDGKVYDEMHVDGGVANQVFIFPAQVNLADLDKRVQRTATRRIYVIRNARLHPDVGFGLARADEDRRSVDFLAHHLSGHRRRQSHLSAGARRRRRFQSGLCPGQLRRQGERTIRSRLHACVIRARLRAGACGIQMGQEAARPVRTFPRGAARSLRLWS